MYVLPGAPFGLGPALHGRRGGWKQMTRRGGFGWKDEEEETVDVRLKRRRWIGGEVGKEEKEESDEEGGRVGG